ncbi:MAG: hypothetical protein ABWY00_11555, partial [Dongiaceae bacterium]
MIVNLGGLNEIPSLVDQLLYDVVACLVLRHFDPHSAVTEYIDDGNAMARRPEGASPGYSIMPQPPGRLFKASPIFR